MKYIWLNNKDTYCLYNFIKILSSFLISVLVLRLELVDEFTKNVPGAFGRFIGHLKAFQNIVVIFKVNSISYRFFDSICRASRICRRRLLISCAIIVVFLTRIFQNLNLGKEWTLRCKAIELESWRCIVRRLNKELLEMIRFWLVSLFNGISNFVGYLMPKPFSQKNSSGTI